MKSTHCTVFLALVFALVASLLLAAPIAAKRKHHPAPGTSQSQLINIKNLPPIAVDPSVYDPTPDPCDIAEEALDGYLPRTVTLKKTDTSLYKLEVKKGASIVACNLSSHYFEVKFNAALKQYGKIPYVGGWNFISSTSCSLRMSFSLGFSLPSTVILSNLNVLASQLHQRAELAGQLPGQGCAQHDLPQHHHVQRLSGRGIRRPNSLSGKQASMTNLATVDVDGGQPDEAEVTAGLLLAACQNPSQAVAPAMGRLHHPATTTWFPAGMLEVATPEIAESVEVAAEITKRTAVVEAGIGQVAAVAAWHVAGGHAIGVALVVTGVADEGVGDHAAEHHPSKSAHEVAQTCIRSSRGEPQGRRRSYLKRKRGTLTPRFPLCQASHLGQCDFHASLTTLIPRKLLNERSDGDFRPNLGIKLPTNPLHSARWHSGVIEQWFKDRISQNRLGQKVVDLEPQDLVSFRIDHQSEVLAQDESDRWPILSVEIDKQRVEPCGITHVRIESFDLLPIQVGFSPRPHIGSWPGCGRGHIRFSSLGCSLTRAASSTCSDPIREVLSRDPNSLSMGLGSTVTFRYPRSYGRSNGDR